MEMSIKKIGDHRFREIKYKKLGKSLNKQVRNAIYFHKARTVIQKLWHSQTVH